MKGKKYIWIGLGILLIIVIGVIGFYFFNAGDSIEPEGDFEIDTLFLKVAIKENGTAISNVKIENTNSVQEFFSVKIIGINELVSLEVESLTLEPGEEANIGLNFDADETEPGVYLGELEIASDGESHKIPIILEIESEIVIFDANVNLYPQGKDIIPGQKLNANIKIFDLASFGRNNVEVIYFLKSFDGRTIDSDTQNIIVEGTGSHSKTLDIPQNIRLGNYVFITLIKYTDIIGEVSVGTSSVFFKVVEEEEAGRSLTDNTLFLILGIFIFFFMIFLGMFIYSIYSRDKLLKEIQGQYRGEVGKQRVVIKDKEKIELAKLKSATEKKAYKKEIAKIKKQRLGALSNMKNVRMKKVKQIKKKGKKGKGQLHRQLLKWKKQGYDTGVLNKYKIPSAEGIKRKVRQWKKQGYNTKVLDERLKKKR